MSRLENGSGVFNSSKHFCVSWGWSRDDAAADKYVLWGKPGARWELQGVVCDAVADAVTRAVVGLAGGDECCTTLSTHFLTNTP